MARPSTTRLHLLCNVDEVHLSDVGRSVPRRIARLTLGLRDIGTGTGIWAIERKWLAFPFCWAPLPNRSHERVFVLPGRLNQTCRSPNPGVLG